MLLPPFFQYPLNDFPHRIFDPAFLCYLGYCPQILRLAVPHHSRIPWPRNPPPHIPENPRRIRQVSQLVDPARFVAEKGDVRALFAAYIFPRRRKKKQMSKTIGCRMPRTEEMLHTRIPNSSGPRTQSVQIERLGPRSSDLEASGHTSTAVQSTPSSARGTRALWLSWMAGYHRLRARFDNHLIRYR